MKDELDVSKHPEIKILSRIKLEHIERNKMMKNMQIEERMKEDRQIRLMLSKIEQTGTSPSDGKNLSKQSKQQQSEFRKHRQAVKHMMIVSYFVLLLALVGILHYTVHDNFICPVATYLLFSSFILLVCVTHARCCTGKRVLHRPLPPLFSSGSVSRPAGASPQQRSTSIAENDEDIDTDEEKEPRRLEIVRIAPPVENIVLQSRRQSIITVSSIAMPIESNRLRDPEKISIKE